MLQIPTSGHKFCCIRTPNAHDTPKYICEWIFYLDLSHFQFCKYLHNVIYGIQIWWGVSCWMRTSNFYLWHKFCCIRTLDAHDTPNMFVGEILCRSFTFLILKTHARPHMVINCMFCWMRASITYLWVQICIWTPSTHNTPKYVCRWHLNLISHIFNFESSKMASNDTPRL